MPSANCLLAKASASRASIASISLSNPSPALLMTVVPPVFTIFAGNNFCAADNTDLSVITSPVILAPDPLRSFPAPALADCNSFAGALNPDLDNAPPAAPSAVWVPFAAAFAPLTFVPSLPPDMRFLARLPLPPPLRPGGRALC